MPHIFKGNLSLLESKERKKILPAKRILQIMDIKKGDTFIDFGCGIGYFSIPALDYVGEKGKVIAIDVSYQMLQELIKRIGQSKNLKTIQGDSLDGLTANIILLSMVLHEVNEPKKFLDICFKALKPNGRVFIIDWAKKETGTMGPPFEDRLAKEEVIKLTDMIYREHFIHKWIYFLEFTKG
jgi:ubiquinone/menaquinone biosynthesis C-methylase UbiE